MNTCGCSDVSQKEKMSISQRFKRTLQAMILAIAIIYTTLVLYQSAYGYPNIQSIQIPYEVPPEENVDVIVASQQQQRHIQSDGEQPQQPKPEQQQDQQQDQQQNQQDQDKNDLSQPASDTRRNLLLRDFNERSVTATPKPPITELDDIFISVKTTKHNHDSRLAVVIKTWWQLARDQTWFFTDVDDEYYRKKTNGHLINTKCPVGHNRKGLCCKMSSEFDVFLESGKKWFCHFDDDNYVNVPRLVRYLDDYSPTLDWYLGKPSISMPINTYLPENKSTKNKKIKFWFGTGGAGFCLSRALTQRMLPVAGGGKFKSMCDKIRFPDDVTMGFIIDHLLQVPLTVAENFHSHLEPLEFIRPATFNDQVSLSYVKRKDEWNTIKIDGFDHEADPTRFLSLHCYLFPYFSFCPR